MVSRTDVTVKARMDPLRFRHTWTLDDGTDVTIRPIQPTDADIEQAFVRSLSPQSKRSRFFSPIKELSPSALRRFTQTNYPADMALIATIVDNGAEFEIGVGRFAPGSRPGTAEFAIAVADEWQGMGIATQLLRNLFDIANETGISEIEGFVMRENTGMLNLATDLGFVCLDHTPDPQLTYIRKKFRED